MSFEQVCRAVRRRLGIGMTLTLIAILAPAAAGLGADAVPNSAPDAVEMVARGSFGVVAGLAQDATPDPAGLTVLDAWARGTTLEMAPVDGTIVGDSAATALAEPGLVVVRSLDPLGGVGSHAFQLPDTGLFLVRFQAMVQPGSGGPASGTWWWRIAVPDRDLPEGEDTVPPPDIQLGSGDQIETLERGSGCYVGTCGDIGATAPPDLLPSIRTVPGAPLTVSVSDGSGMTGWYLEATPKGGTDADAVTLGNAMDMPSTPRIVVPAPAEGSWVIVAHVTFDHERGSFDGYGRLALRPRDGG